MGTYVGVGSTNRRADHALIAEMPRFALGELPIPAIDSEVVDFRAASESSSPSNDCRAGALFQLAPVVYRDSVRLPDTLLTELKLLANECDAPYQSLLKVYLTDRVQAEQRRQRAKA